MIRKISKSAVDNLKPGQIIVDSTLAGFMVRRLPSGVVTYGYRYRDRRSGRRWVSIGQHGDVTADQARRKALQIARDVAEGRRPLTAREESAQGRTAAGGTVNATLDAFLDRHVRPNLRSAYEVERCFRAYVRPEIGARSVYDLRRRDIVTLLDKIEDENGPVMCDRVLAHLRKCFNWVASRDDQFNSPIVKGMARTKPAERARKRVLDDQEIRDLWTALDTLNNKVPACFPAFTKTLLLTGERLRMVSNMPWSEIDGRDWIIPPARNKGKTQAVVPLTDTVIDLLGKRRKGFVFSSNGGKTAFQGFSKAKAALDGRLAEIRKQAGRPPMKHWLFHDLRRVARSTMARAGVPADHAERVLGHIIPGVRGTYDRHEYRAEKLAALERLGALVERILHPRESVVRFPKGRNNR
jgi:integrase